MYGGLAYKEWIKLRWFLLIVGLISLATIVDLFLTARRLFEFMEPIEVWNNVIHRQVLIYSGLKFNAIIGGVAFALVQFLPETMKRRLRILFHLPVSHNKSLYFMLGAGLATLLLVILLNVAGMAVILPAFFPREVLASALVTAAPWFLAGIAAYFGTVLVVVEPVWWRRALYAGMTYTAVQLYLSGGGYETYAEALCKYALLAALFVPTVILPAFRFKRGLHG